MEVVPQFLFVVWLVGLLPAFWVVYFRNGLSKVKSVHGIDWREFGLSNVGFWLGHFVFWPVGVAHWLAQGKPAKSMAVIQVDGRKVRQFVSIAEYSVDDGVATRLALQSE